MSGVMNSLETEDALFSLFHRRVFNMTITYDLKTVRHLGWISRR